MTDTSMTHEHSDAPEASTDSSDVPEGALVTFFQPFYNLRTTRLQGLEALTRRRDGDGHAALPAEFFADAEARGRMREIDLRTLDDALEHLAVWRRDEAQRDLILSVNLAFDTVAHPEFVADVAQRLRRHRVPGDRLLVDITTDTFRRLAADDEQALARLRSLQDLEMTFCLDGFTAGDLELLPVAAAVPVDVIKLHPRVLTQGTRQEVADVARAIQDAGLPIVAAGVETAEELRLVRELDFEWAQGFVLGRPADAELVFSQASALPEL
ncbi:EAL domain-containing protein [Mobilicoccus massiliensis]|uniref:EAL domain-containing protein n=1 Tax=Mobilicoccus massiliensis TaxID=1522310 RepID=UPI00058E93B2|nr:EAL domain-containing protein [Mobilicoccus massiliensis]